MPRRSKEPDEAFGPMIDGMEDVVSLAKALLDPPEEVAEEPEAAVLPDPEQPQIVLVCGDGDDALAVAKLARDCGFEIELVSDSAHPLGEELVDVATDVHIVENYEDFVAVCKVDRNHYVCIFVEDAAECESILLQCLPSDAAYVGACTDSAEAYEIMSGLRSKGAPDAELAAVCCPMGLAIGANTPAQEAVAIVAEIMAARSGVLKRLRSIE